MQDDNIIRIGSREFSDDQFDQAVREYAEKNSLTYQQAFTKFQHHVMEMEDEHRRAQYARDQQVKQAREKAKETESTDFENALWDILEKRYTRTNTPQLLEVHQQLLGFHQRDARKYSMNALHRLIDKLPFEKIATLTFDNDGYITPTEIKTYSRS